MGTAKRRQSACLLLTCSLALFSLTDVNSSSPGKLISSTNLSFSFSGIFDVEQRAMSQALPPPSTVALVDKVAHGCDFAAKMC